MKGLSVRKLSTFGIMGLNRRNSDYVLDLNPRRRYPLVDDKLRTKALAMENGLAVPGLYGVVKTEHQIRWLPKLLEKCEDFVVKPARGSGGKGILVVEEQRKGRYRKSSGVLISQDEIDQHVGNIISGLYSLGAHRDQAMIEYRVKVDPLFRHISYGGVPDIRVVVFQGYPVMAMVRLPTRKSDGKANLHQGAVGAGVDLARGVTLSGVYLGRLVEEHPETAESLRGLCIPGWKDLLELAARCYEVVGLGYMGVDVVLDEELGPLILEINARPGLGIQIANRAGLLPRLQALQNRSPQEEPPKERVAIVTELFGQPSQTPATAPRNCSDQR
jgi:alpha-L-glutamate ligase-like protein